MPPECPDILNVLLTYEAGELTPEGRETVARHLSGCPACRVARLRVASVRSTLAACPPPVPPAGAVTRLLARLAATGNAPSISVADGPSASGVRFRFSRTDFAVAAVLLLAAVGIVVPMAGAARRSARKAECVQNLHFMGAALAEYVDRYGAGREYPPYAGGAFWMALRRFSPVAFGSDPFVCAVRQDDVGVIPCDYRGPAAGRKLSPGILAGVRILGADREANHDPGMSDDVNVLLLDGRVETAACGSMLWARAAIDTAE